MTNQLSVDQVNSYDYPRLNTYLKHLFKYNDYAKNVK
jgi:hypothetical protein